MLCKIYVLFFGRYAKEVCDAIVAKCLTGRPKTVEKSQTVFMLWVELEAVEAFLVCYSSIFLCKTFLLCVSLLIVWVRAE